MPEISVVMPVYNASQYLAEAIESIVSQTFTDWELIIIDDGSTDDSKLIIKRYAQSDKRIRYYKNEQNMGVIRTLNKGINLSTGKYIARMDADDISLPTRFDTQYRFLENNADVAMCGTYALLIDEKGNETGRITYLESDEYLRINLLFSPSFIHPSMMIRTDVLKKNLYDESYKHAEDYELWCRIASNHKVANLPSFLLKYRWHTTNVSVVNNFFQEDTKKRIMREGLQRLALNPDKEELRLHTVSYKQYDTKEKIEKKDFSDYDKLDDWFSKIINANKLTKIYKPNALSAHLWSRWIVLCIAQKNRKKLLSKPHFVSLRLSVLLRLVRLIHFYSKK